MRESDLAAMIEKASEGAPDVRWLGALVNDDREVALTGVQDGLAHTERFGGDTGRTFAEAMTEIRGQLRYLWQRA